MHKNVEALNTNDPPPSIFRYFDFREYLRQAYAAEKSRNPVFSHRFIARELGSRSPSFFNDILNGRQLPSMAQSRGFVRLFRMTRKEAEHFEDMVLYAQAKTEKEKAACLAKLVSQTDASGHAVHEMFQKEYFKKWYYAAVRELLGVYDFRGDYAELASLLEPALTIGEALDAIQVLLHLKLIRKASQGRFERTARFMGVLDSSRAECIRPALHASLELAQRALDAHPPASRPFSSLTVGISAEAVARIDREAHAFRQRILEIASENDGNQVYQLNLQLFPLSCAIPPAKRPERRSDGAATRGSRAHARR